MIILQNHSFFICRTIFTTFALTISKHYTFVNYAKHWK
jgi:hypothetical protein